MRLNFTTLDFVRQKVAADDDGKRDYFCPIEHLTYEVAERSGQSLIICPFGQFTLTPFAESQLCQKLGIPVSYLRRCPLWLKRENIDYWLEQRKREGGEVLLRTKGEWLRAFLSKSYSIFDNKDLLDMLSSVPSVGKEILPHASGLSLTDKSFHLPLIKPESIEVQNDGRKERLYLGVYLRNSEVGFLRVSLSACLHREGCGNIFVSSCLLSKVHIGIEKDVLSQKIGEFIGKALSLTAPKIASALIKALSVEISEQQRGRVFLRAAKLAGKKALVELFEQEYRREKIESGIGDTLFTATQAITRVAQHLHDADDRYILSRFATELLPIDGCRETIDSPEEIADPRLLLT